MKRLIGVIAMLMIFTFAISGCKDNTKVGEEKPIEDKPVVNIQNQETNLPLNENFDLEKSMESIFEAVESETRELTEEEVNEKYNFDGIEKLEKKTIITSSENKYEEVTIIKLTDTSQYYTVQSVADERVNDLKNEFKESENILKILEKNENIKIKIQDGVAIFVVSDRSDEIMKNFDNEF